MALKISVLMPPGFPARPPSELHTYMIIYELLGYLCMSDRHPRMNSPTPPTRLPSAAQAKFVTLSRHFQPPAISHLDYCRSLLTAVSASTPCTSTVFSKQQPEWSFCTLDRSPLRAYPPAALHPTQIKSYKSSKLYTIWPPVLSLTLSLSSLLPVIHSAPATLAACQAGSHPSVHRSLSKLRLEF